jgi:hypothetical protein
MPLEIPERDWKVLRKLKPIALDRFCKRALAELKYRAKADDGEHHAAYLAVYKAMQERDAEIAAAFNDMRRSQAFLRLIGIRRLKLLTDEEWNEFSEKTQRSVFDVADG